MLLYQVVRKRATRNLTVAGVGKAWALRYGEELARLHGMTVLARTRPGIQNALATPCGRAIEYDPIMFGRIALDPLVGPDGVGIAMAHEFGHLLACAGDCAAQERTADWLAGHARGLLGYSSDAGINIFGRYIVGGDACHAPWQVRVRDYQAGWYFGAIERESLA